MRSEIELLGRRAFYYVDIGSFLKYHGQQLDFSSDELVDGWVEENRNYLEEIAEDTSSNNKLVYRSDLEHSEPEDVNITNSVLGSFYIYTYFVAGEDKELFFVEVEVEFEVEAEVEYSYRAEPWEREDWDDSLWRHEVETQIINSSITLSFQVNKKTKKTEMI